MGTSCLKTPRQDPQHRGQASPTLSLSRRYPGMWCAFVPLDPMPLDKGEEVCLPNKVTQLLSSSPKTQSFSHEAPAADSTSTAWGSLYRGAAGIILVLFWSAVMIAYSSSLLPTTKGTYESASDQDLLELTY